jgi:competence protein ComEC
VFTARFHSLLPPWLPITPDWLRRYAAVSLASTVAIWVGLWPLLAWYFHLVSPVSVLANLVLVPLVSLLVVAGTIVLAVGTVVSAAVGWSGVGLEWLLGLIVACVQWCHRVPLGWWPVGHPPRLVIAGYYGLVALTLARHRLRLSVGSAMACWLVGLNAGLWSQIGMRAAASRWLDVTVLNVGQGDSLVVRTPSRHTLLIDAGTQEAGRYVVAPFLRFNGFHTLDALVLTHFDEDHAGGVIPLLREVRVKRLLTNGATPTTWTTGQAMELVRMKRLRHDRITAGMRLTGASGIAMMVLHPPPGFVPGTMPWSNDNSVVIKLVKQDVSLLFCGDLEERGLPWLMRWGHTLAATVLKAPHHGSALGSWGRSFIERVHPAVAVISVGRRQGFPSDDVLRDLAAVGAQVMLTRRDGAITLRTDGTRLMVKTLQSEKRWLRVLD